MLRKCCGMKKSYTYSFAVIFIFSLCLCMASSSFSQENVSRLVEAEAVFPIIDNDVEKAREIAIFNAKRQIVEPLGVTINSDTSYSMGIKIADWFKIKWGGYIKDYEILEEQKVQEGYKVKIRAWVKSGEEEKDVARDLLNPKKILIISEGDGGVVVESLLTPELNTLGYRYHGTEYIRNNVKPKTWYDLIHRRLLYLDDDTFKFMADLIIYVQSSVGFNTYDSAFHCNWFWGNVRILLFTISGERAGEPIIEVRQSSDKLLGHGNDDIERSMQDALMTGHPNGFKTLIAMPIISSFMKEFINNKFLQGRDRNVTVTITKVPSQREYDRFLELVRYTHGVDGRVSEQSRRGGTYTLNVMFPMKSVYLGYLLSVNRNYILTGHSWNRVDIEYRR